MTEKKKVVIIGGIGHPYRIVTDKDFINELAILISAGDCRSLGDRGMRYPLS